MKESMAKSCDRISELPDGILESILSSLPMKVALRSSVLSKRWRNLWKYLWIHATTLDFGKEFAKAQTQEQFVNTVNQYLQLHSGNKIEKFLLHFYPGEHYKANVEKWIEFAILRGVEELDLIFCQATEKYTLVEIGEYKVEIDLLAILFGYDSLVHLRTSHIELNLPIDFTGFSSLQTLCLSQVSITDDTLESIVSKCPLLTNLYLRYCNNLGSIKVAGPNLQLKTLSVILTDAYEVDIFAPNLKSVHFHGGILYGYDFRNVSALEDVFISAAGYEHTEPEHDFIQIFSGVSHIKILTMCIAPPMHIAMLEEYFPDNLPLSLPNLQELQILIGGQIGEEYLGYTFSFFKHTICPCLEKLFIDLSCPYSPWKPDTAKEAEEPSSCFFYNLQIVKITSFQGSHTEMKMVEFFLDKAVVLESLVLVVASDFHLEKDIDSIKEGDGVASQSENCNVPLRILHDQLLQLPKVSTDAQILLFEHWEVDTSLCPKHKHAAYHLDNICCY
ncbi:hypothetical protein IFM89_020803 [Coptis chinensis]|uniref:F-box domain-containing protein n=1 Tax=Coptis chinensis TaxID=261450 RepID=A0A835IZP0_9MAGN|nr:hypothetical protein IFM89_020803 [Coptis chinensis]